MLLLFPILAQAETSTQCQMYYITAKHGHTEIPVSSDHSFSITNTTGSTKTYHVTYTNEVMYTSPWYSPIAKKVFDVTIANGQTINEPTERLMQSAYFSVAGTYPTKATTTIKLDGKLLASCTNKNTASIF